MPQTLLAVAALAFAGLLTLSQKQATHGSLESVVRDQFELAVAGTLLHTIEFADARAFDHATSPAALRARYGLPPVMTAADRDSISADDFVGITTDDLTAPADFGGVVCNVTTPSAALDCDDIDDLHDGDWQAVEFKTPDGHPLPVDVRVRVAYVEAADPDVEVGYRTFHKKVEVMARSRVTAGGWRRPLEVQLQRVISFDPVVAAEYLRRSITVVGDLTCSAEVAAWAAQRDALAASADAADAALGEARARISASHGALDAARAPHADARARYDAALRDYEAGRAAVASAERALGAFELNYGWAQGHPFFGGAYVHYHNQYSRAVTDARAAEARAQTAVTAAAARLDGPAAALAQAEGALAQAQAALVQAEAQAGTTRDALDAYERAGPPCS